MILTAEGVFDRLTSGAATGQWAVANGIGPEASFERRWANTKAADLVLIKAHRTRLRSVVEGLGAPTDRRLALAGIASEMLQTMPVWLRFDHEQLQFGMDDSSLKVLLPLIGRSLGQFVQQGDPARIKQCKSDECILFFVDETRPGNRRWCDGAGCGNRNRVRRHAGRSNQ